MRGGVPGEGPAVDGALLEMRAIVKAFPGVRALDGVDLAVAPGELHALVGENGAGKSTLMKVLSGVYPHGEYEGEIRFDGEPLRLSGIADAEARGIVVIHQELALVPTLSIAENLFLGNEIARGGVIDWPATYARAAALLERVGLRVPVSTPVGELGVGRQQLVEIAKALAKRVRLLILDEPTASLQENDSAALLGILDDLRREGVTSILISHKLGEVGRVADRVTVLRDGATVAGVDVRNGPLDEAEIVRAMVGRDLTERFPPRRAELGETLLEVRDWRVGHETLPGRFVVDGVSFRVRAGEVVGIAGLMGAGRTELAMSLFGRSHGASFAGEVRVRGEIVDVSTVDRAIAAGLAYVTEDRKGLGLILEESVARNVTLANLVGVSRRGVIDGNAEVRVAEDYRARLGIRTPGVAQATVNLSGGNQQKVVIGKWLHTDPDVLILDEPTRGIDVGAKYEIYGLVNRLAEAGKAVIVISSEMPELLGLCDRLHVMNEGRFVGELDAAEATQEKVMAMIVDDRPAVAGVRTGAAVARDGDAAGRAA